MKNKLTIGITLVTILSSTFSLAQEIENPSNYPERLEANALIVEKYASVCPHNVVTDDDAREFKFCVTQHNHLESMYYTGPKMLDLYKQMHEESLELEERYNKIMAEKIEREKKPGVIIGMTTNQVINETSWGTPHEVNRTTTSTHVFEQWVYSPGGYLYFTNGILTTIQN